MARSRRGCKDCKQAKIKCDEVHPSCGTCARRRRQCSGYSTYEGPSRRPSASPDSVATDHQASAYLSQRMPLQWAPSEIPRGCKRMMDQMARDTWLITSSRNSADDYMRSVIMEVSTRSRYPQKGPAPICLSEILAADRPLIEVYFMRHPSEMVMSDDCFIREMNGAVMSLLQQSPTAVGDALAAIGENYLKGAVDSALVSNRKLRLVSRLRLINEEENDPELALMILLALCGVELVDPQSDGDGAVLSALIDNVAMILAYHTQERNALSGMAKYFVRGMARQDLLISLSQMKRPKIDSSVWLDEYTMCHADRLMGLTASLSPILSKLAALAQDVKSGEWRLIESHSLAAEDNDLLEREACIRAQLESWRPIRDRSLSLQISRKLLSHAYTWRAAALLYLFRLFNRPGTSMEADMEALSMAYEVIAHISGSPQETKLSLWPLFIAANCKVHQVLLR
ncbi:fungal-specific transcription factor domain-containing protein [Aspergillus multicolor]|uniref:Zn(II)2Cys6 transcription factor n=1 Tax=Aspergillus multicolor TaxID=41759 RepID=UPI003CCE1A62